METLLNMVGNALGALMRALGFAGRPRLRAAIREDLQLLHELEQVPAFAEETPLHNVMLAHVGTEVLRLVGAPVLGERKKVQWGSVCLGGIVGFPLAYWTYALNRSGFTVWSLIPGGVSFFFLVGGFFGGLFPGRVAPEDLGIVEESATAAGDAHQSDALNDPSQ